ncbi:MAG: uridine kinase [Lewinellaceae bacterium]|nr:uridine kinase [Saprospiraceae bacterium]MCB9307732.1 uridine kinase [Lewinellaceae bacterium]
MKPFVIGISGGSGSGKTSFIRALSDRFSKAELCIVSQDDYYLPREQQHKDENEEYNFDLPKSFNKKKFREDIGHLIAGESITIEEYTFNNPKAKPRRITFHPAPVLVIEGLFVLHFKKIAPLLDLRVFINAKENLKIIRRIMRDQVERGYPLDDVLYKYQHHVLPSYERYIQPYKEEADIIVNNNRDFQRGLDVLSGFIRSKLTDISKGLKK